MASITEQDLIDSMNQLSISPDVKQAILDGINQLKEEKDAAKKSQENQKWLDENLGNMVVMVKNFTYEIEKEGGIDRLALNIANDSMYFNYYSERGMVSPDGLKVILKNLTRYFFHDGSGYFMYDASYDVLLEFDETSEVTEFLDFLKNFS